MNPYTLGSFGESAIVFLFCILIVICGAYITKHSSASASSEGYFRGAARGLLFLNASVLIVEILGVLGFAVGVKSLLWYFWLLPYMAGVVATFKAFPLIGAGLCVWGEVGRRKHSYSTRTFRIILKCFALNSICAGLFFVVERMIIASAVI
jgi:hypothetical protein